MAYCKIWENWYRQIATVQQKNFYVDSTMRIYVFWQSKHGPGYGVAESNHNLSETGRNGIRFEKILKLNDIAHNETHRRDAKRRKSQLASSLVVFEGGWVDIKVLSEDTP